MKLRNKKTGEIKELPDGFFCGDSLKKICEEWEDYNEPKEYWYVDTTEGSIVEHTQEMFELTDKERKETGNYFLSREEAERAVEKLKAWKRLKDFGCGFMLNSHFTVKFVGPDARKITSAEEQKSLSDAYKLLFGGK